MCESSVPSSAEFARPSGTARVAVFPGAELDAERFDAVSDGRRALCVSVVAARWGPVEAGQAVARWKSMPQRTSTMIWLAEDSSILARQIPLLVGESAYAHGPRRINQYSTRRTTTLQPTQSALDEAVECKKMSVNFDKKSSDLEARLICNHRLQLTTVAHERRPSPPSWLTSPRDGWACQERARCGEAFTPVPRPRRGSVWAGQYLEQRPVLHLPSAQGARQSLLKSPPEI